MHARAGNITINATRKLAMKRAKVFVNINRLYDKIITVDE